MAEDPGQIRVAIEQTRADIGETVQAIGDKPDIKGQAAKEAAARRAQLRCLARLRPDWPSWAGRSSAACPNRPDRWSPQPPGASR